jgi:hypothetical protein
MRGCQGTDVSGRKGTSVEGKFTCAAAACGTAVASNRPTPRKERKEERYKRKEAEV